MIVFYNGRLMWANQVILPLNDHGFLYGDGVYETLIAHNGKASDLDEHLKRLKQSARGLSLQVPFTKRRLGRAIGQLIQKNKLTTGRAVIRVTLTRGPGPHGFDPRPCKHPTLLMVAKPFDGYPAEFYRHGIRAAIVSIQRNSPESLPPSIKSISCLNGVLAKIESTRVKAQEGIMLDAQGHVSEGTVSNIFAVKNNTLLTPQLDGGLLAGVTRARVLRLARRAGYKTIEKKIVPRDLFNADEIFLTSTLMGVMPVRELLWKGKVCFRARHFAATMQLASICKQ